MTRNHNSLDDYIYIRLDKGAKKKLKERARKDGSNMTIWVRQLVMKELNNSQRKD